MGGGAVRRVTHYARRDLPNGTVLNEFVRAERIDTEFGLGPRNQSHDDERSSADLEEVFVRRTDLHSELLAGTDNPGLDFILAIGAQGIGTRGIGVQRNPGIGHIRSPAPSFPPSGGTHYIPYHRLSATSPLDRLDAG